MSKTAFARTYGCDPERIQGSFKIQKNCSRLKQSVPQTKPASHSSDFPKYDLISDTANLKGTALPGLFKGLKDLETKHNVFLQSSCAEMRSTLRQIFQGYQLLALPGKKFRCICPIYLSSQLAEISLYSRHKNAQYQGKRSELKGTPKIMGKMHANRRNLRSFVQSQPSRQVKHFLIPLSSVLILPLIYTPEKVKKFNLQTDTEITAAKEVESSQK